MFADDNEKAQQQLAAAEAALSAAQHLGAIAQVSEWSKQELLAFGIASLTSDVPETAHAAAAVILSTAMQNPGDRYALLNGPLCAVPQLLQALAASLPREDRVEVSRQQLSCMAALVWRSSPAALDDVLQLVPAFIHVALNSNDDGMLFDAATGLADVAAAGGAEELMRLSVYPVMNQLAYQAAANNRSAVVAPTLTLITRMTESATFSPGAGAGANMTQWLHTYVATPPAHNVTALAVSAMTRLVATDAAACLPTVLQLESLPAMTAWLTGWNANAHFHGVVTQFAVTLTEAAIGIANGEALLLAAVQQGVLAVLCRSAALRTDGVLFAIALLINHSSDKSAVISAIHAADGVVEQLQLIAEDPQAPFGYPDHAKRILAASGSEGNAEVGQLPALVEACHSNDVACVLRGVRGLRQLLSNETGPPINSVLASGVVPRLLDIMSEPSRGSDVQYEAAWALTNIASGDTNHTGVLVEMGAVQRFIALMMSSSHDNVVDQTVWAIGNIAGDSVRHRDYVLSNGGAQALVATVQANANSRSILRNAAFALSNCVRHKPSPPLQLALPIAEAMIALIGASSGDQEILADALWGLSYIADISDEAIAGLVARGAAQHAMALLPLVALAPSVLTPALRVISNIVSGDDQATMAVVSHEAFPIVVQLLDSAFATKRTLLKEVCFLLSNVAAGSVPQIQLLVHLGVFPLLKRTLLSPETDLATKKECVWCFANALEGGTADVVAHMEVIGVLDMLCQVLAGPDRPDQKCRDVALDAVRNLVRIHEPQTEEWASNCATMQRLNMKQVLEELLGPVGDSSRSIAFEILSMTDGNDGLRDDSHPDLSALTVS
jgi:hypothetical protein